MADIQGKLVPLLLSADNWTTSLTLVCLVSSGFKTSFPVNEEESQCGVHVGIGSNKFSIDFQAIAKTDPAAVAGGVGEASYKQVLAWSLNQTKLKFKRQHGTNGADFYQSGEVYLNDLSEDAATGQIVKFSGTLTGTGTLDITP